MHTICNVFLGFINLCAQFGAGIASVGFGYEPKMPECLKK